VDIDEVRRCFREGTFEFSSHANQERGRARLSVLEVQQAGCRASLVREEPDARGGTRCLIAGLTDTGRRVSMPIVWTEGGGVLIVTV